MRCCMWCGCCEAATCQLEAACPHRHVLQILPCRLESWLQAALARPSAQSSKPADDFIVKALAPFVADLKH